MRPTVITTIIAASFAASICVAEDVRVIQPTDFSIRVAYGSTPGIEEVKFNKGGGTKSLDADFGGRSELLAVIRFWGNNESNIGGMFGAGLFFAGHSGKDVGGVEVDVLAFGSLFQGGLAVQAGENVVLEFGPYLGLGIANSEARGYTYRDGSGPYTLFGIKGGAFVLLGENIELGLEVGYEGFSTKHESKDDIFSSTDVITFSGGGPRVAGVLVVKF